jgi:hypothetical protein
MSHERHFDENPYSPDAVKAFFLQLARGGAAGRDPLEIWRTIVAEPWLQAEVKRRAGMFAFAHNLSNEAREDIEQEVMLMLASQISSHPTLHANAELLPDSFGPWLGTIINRDLSKCARRRGEYRPPHEKLDHVEPHQRDEARTEQRIKVALAVAMLEGRERLVMTLVLQGLSKSGGAFTSINRIRVSPQLGFNETAPAPNCPMALNHSVPVNLLKPIAVRTRELGAQTEFRPSCLANTRCPRDTYLGRATGW